MFAFLKSPLWHQRLMLAALWQLIFAVLRVRHLPFPRLMARARRPVQHLALQNTEADLAETRRVGQIIRRVAKKLPFAVVCLPQALAAQEILRRRGIITSLHLGVRQDQDGTLPAHAWLSCHGIPLLGQEEIHTFTLLHTLTPARSPLFQDSCFAFLCNACRVGVQPETSVPIPQNWQHLLALARRHRVSALLHAHLQKYPAESVPADLLAALAQDRKKTVQQNMLAAAVLGRLSQAFAKAGIPFLLLKSYAVGLLYYPDATLRQSRDLDILIDLSDYQAAYQALLDAGFVHEGYVAKADWQQQHIFTAEYDAKFRCAHTGQLIEMHWRPARNPYAYQPSFHDLWRTARKVSLGGCEVMAMSEAEQFIYLCDHGSKHAWFRLKWLVDIHAIVQSGRLDIEHLRHLAKERKATRGFELALLMVNEIFGSQLECRKSWFFLPLARAYSRHLLACEKIDALMQSLRNRIIERMIYTPLFNGLGRATLWQLRYPWRIEYAWEMVQLPGWARSLYLPLWLVLWVVKVASRRVS